MRYRSPAASPGLFLNLAETLSRMTDLGDQQRNQSTKTATSVEHAVRPNFSNRSAFGNTPPRSHITPVRCDGPHFPKPNGKPHARNECGLPPHDIASPGRNVLNSDLP